MINKYILFNRHFPKFNFQIVNRKTQLFLNHDYFIGDFIDNKGSLFSQFVSIENLRNCIPYMNSYGKRLYKGEFIFSLYCLSLEHITRLFYDSEDIYCYKIKEYLLL